VGELFTGRHISTTPASARQSETSSPSCNTIRQRYVMARGQQPSDSIARSDHRHIHRQTHLARIRYRFVVIRVLSLWNRLGLFMSLVDSASNIRLRCTKWNTTGRTFFRTGLLLDVFRIALVIELCNQCDSSHVTKLSWRPSELIIILLS